jgi:ABC-type Fe3+/spermidine/putrescine transport system ATPase subunit
LKNIMAITITIDDVTRRFGNLTALDHVSISIEAGEFFTLLGPSGSGKSTLLRQLAGFDTPDSGRILFDGEDMTHIAANNRPSNTVFQDLALFPHMNVGQNVGYGLKIKRISSQEIGKRVKDALALVGLEGFADRDVNKLSGGQRQRVALARSLIMEPGVVLLDEPLTGLDENLRQQMRDEFGRLHTRTGATFVLVTHNQDEALSLSDRMAIMRDGRIEQVGTPENFFRQPANSFVGRFMGMECIVKPEKLETRGGDQFALVGGVPVPVIASESALASKQAVVAFRPDQIEFLNSEASDRASIVLEVVAVRYRGLHFDIHTIFPDRQKVVISHKSVDGVRLPAVGEKIPVVFASGAPLLLTEK